MRRNGTISVPFAVHLKPPVSLLPDTRHEPDSHFAAAAVLISKRVFGEFFASPSQSNAESNNQPRTSQAHESIPDAPDIPIDQSEIPGISAFYKALIAAARSSLSPTIAGAFIRRLRNEKMLAMRAAKDRRRAARANCRAPQRPSCPRACERFSSNQPQ